MTDANTLTAKKVAHIAKLANLKLTGREIVTFTSQLEDIIQYIQKLNELDTGRIPPTVSTASLENVTRPDIIKPSLSQKDALANAKDIYDGYFKVKAVLEKN